MTGEAAVKAPESGSSVAGKRAALLRLGGRLDRLARGSNARLTPDRAAYLAHPDWAVDPAKRPPAALWSPRIPLDQGMAATAAWYRASGLL